MYTSEIRLKDLIDIQQGECKMSRDIFTCYFYFTDLHTDLRVGETL